ncbi:MAG: ribonuclease J, partial [Acidobacteria bacterium]|nr:ribonuclease J [Acidobacteriota bacterium]
MMTAHSTAVGAPAVEVIPVGGLGEFGMNMMLVACGDTALLIDAGVMFPEPELFGVDLVIPDVAALDRYKGRIAALILTHGHEDHIGAVPHVMPHFNGPVYGTAFTLAMVTPKLDEHHIDHDGRLITVAPRQRVEIGPFTVEFLHVTHSIPDAVALAIHTPQGVIIHTGDFKIDQTPLDGERFDLHRLAELGAQGVLALFGDSTNADNPGHTGSDRDVIPGFEEIFSSAPGRIIVASFSSSIYRMQVLVDLADQFERKVAFVGRGMVRNSETAARLGVLNIPPGIQIADSDLRDYPAQDVLCLCTGSQGEPMAALPRIAIDDHRYVTVQDDDVVVFSARSIPGNEKAIARVMNNLAKRGAEIITDGMKHVHVSGHGSAEELKLVLSLVQPRFFVPIHGEYRQLAQHARLARAVSPTTTVQMLEDGDVFRFDAEGARVIDRLHTGRILVDGTRMGEIGDEILRDRRHLAADGLVVAVVAINCQTGELERPPEVIARGMATDPRQDELLRDAAGLLEAALAEVPREERKDPGLVKERIRLDVQRMFRKRANRRPLV